MTPNRAPTSGSAARTWYAWHRPLAVFVASMSALAAVGVLTDDRYLAGAPVWLKPIKFAISFAIYGISLGWSSAACETASGGPPWPAPFSR